MPLEKLAAAFFLQMAIILAVCRVAGLVGRRLGQPQVVCEMVAGVCLGPSLLGWFAPGLQAQLFPPESLRVLYVGAQLGVGLYMFLVGAEFRVDLFQGRVRSALSVSLAGMLVPFLLGALLTPWLMTIPGLFSAKATLWEATLFLGAAIAITAFPMLARIIHERGLGGTPLGTLALAAGAIDDAAAWCVLAVVLASFGKGAHLAYQAIGGGIAYALFLALVGRRLLVPLGRAVERAGRLTQAHLAILMTLFALGAWAMEAVGIHAVFGGFLLGASLPRGLLTRELQRLVEPFAVVFLLPMFFTFSGLRTRLDTVDSLQMLMVALVVLAASVVGKGVACWGAARLNGEDSATSLAVGTLMNARGLMEL
ncbi:MAG: cation:proton antiporter, partial [Verrucomicrobiota bacterium]